MQKHFLIFPLLMLLSLSLVSAELVVVKEPVFTQGYKNIFGNDYRAKVVFTVKNTGTTTERGIFELGLTQRSLSFFVNKGSCDPATPWTRHVYYEILPGDTLEITILSGQIPPGIYSAMLLHVTGCCTDGVDENGPEECAAKEPFGWGYPLGTVKFKPSGETIECNWDSMCWDVMPNKGIFNCKAVQCNNKSTTAASCECIEYGECNNGGVQSVTCADGETIVTANCITAEWVPTGAKCPEKPAPPLPDPNPPNHETGSNIFINYLPLWTMLIGGVFGIILGPWSALLGGVVGGIIGLVVMLVI